MLKIPNCPEFQVLPCKILYIDKLPATGDIEESKPRRSGNMGLFPFPRVGRSDPEMMAYDNGMYSLEDYGKL